MEGQRKALIVASGEYEHEGLRRLLSPAVDAAALAEVLENPHIGGFDVQIVHNEPAHDIQAQIEDLFSDARPDDVLLVHFSCHGLKNEAGELFFAARNTRPSRLASTAISADFVQRCVRASRSRSIVLLLDCCYGAAFGQGVTVRASGDVNVLDSFPTGKLGGGRGRAVITASNAMEYAFEGERLADDHSAEPSLFTAALVRGLSTGEADRDEDGWVSLNELYEYVFDRVREASPHQTPSRDIEMQGELYVARSRRRRIRPVAVPADLMAATTDPSMYSRVGAIAELRSRLLSDNLPVAIGAHEALTAMAATDIDYVAEKAVTALREADVHVSERELHFGEVAQGASSPHRRLHLAGPPIARVGMVVDASDPWIRIEEGAGWVDVWVDARRVGRMSGGVTIKGSVGEVFVAVDVDMVTSRPQDPQQSSSSVEMGQSGPAGSPSPTPHPPSAGAGEAAGSGDVDSPPPLGSTSSVAPPETGSEPDRNSGRGKDSERAQRPDPESPRKTPANPSPPPPGRYVDTATAAWTAPGWVRPAWGLAAVAHLLSFFLPSGSELRLLDPQTAWNWVALFYLVWAAIPAALLLEAAARLPGSDGRSALLAAVPATIPFVLWAAYIALLNVVEQSYGIGSLLGGAAAALATIATVAVWRASKRAPRKPSTVSKGSA